MVQGVGLRVQGLGLALGGVPLLADLGFDVLPGLTLVCGGDGRGKTSLLRLLVGQIQPSAGQVVRLGGAVHFSQPADAAWDAVVATDWLATQQAQAPAWSASMASKLVRALDLEPHLHKPCYMLSTGSRRKLGVVAAAASGAEVTLLDTPYAALDGRSRQVVDALLREAAVVRERAWVVADFAVPPGLADLMQAGQVAMVSLGD